MPACSAGLLLYRPGAGGTGGIEVLLVHPGGPYFAGRDDGVWSVPKGMVEAGDDPHPTALREFAEELGTPPPAPDPPVADLDLGEIRQAGGKRVVAFARAGDFDADAAVSNTFEMEWPRRSGRHHHFPEVDRAAWFDLPTARRKLVGGQRTFLDRLEMAIDPSRPGSALD